MYPVALVGAGPGHPELLTLRAVECLRRAEFILHDRLVPDRLLEHAPPTARRVCVEDLPGDHPTRWPHIHHTLIDAARQGLRVVRLKGGDPFVFGRGAEEAEALRHAGIPFEIVPGVTAGLGASAFAGVPVTHRLHSSAVAFVTGHEFPGKEGSRLDWEVLARFPGTLVIYMGLAKLHDIASALITHGKSGTTPACAIESGATFAQRTVDSDLAGLYQAVNEAELKAPVLVIVGAVAGLRGELSWFERLPLFGKRVLVTRPRHQAGDLVRQLEELGAIASVVPMVEIAEPDSWDPVDRAIDGFGRYQWLVFTSANGVHAFLKRLRHQGHDLRRLGAVRLAAIGPATAAALEDYHLCADVVPAEFNSEGLAAAMRDQVSGQCVLLARADRGIDLLREELAQVATVEQIAVYSQRDAVPGTLDASVIDCALLTSSNIATAFLGALDEEGKRRVQSGQLRLVTISPRTSAAVRDRGFPVTAEATEYTTQGVVKALCVAEAAG